MPIDKMFVQILHTPRKFLHLSGNSLCKYKLAVIQYSTFQSHNNQSPLRGIILGQTDTHTTSKVLYLVTVAKQTHLYLNQLFFFLSLVLNGAQQPRILLGFSPGLGLASI